MTLPALTSRPQRRRLLDNRNNSQAMLSEIVDKMNDLFEGEELTDADRID
jgi:hypothetical protein